MTTTFPSSVDNFPNPLATDLQSTVDHAAQHANANDAIEAIETTIGVNPLTKFLVTTKGDLIVATSSATVTRLAAGSNGQVLTAQSGQGTGLQWATLSFETTGAVSTHAGLSDPHATASYAIMASGGRRIFTGTTTPTGSVIDGDLWFQPA